MIYLELFISFLKIGLFSFGGGYAAMPLIRIRLLLLVSGSVCRSLQTWLRSLR